MIFNLYPRVVVRLGEERHIFDRSTLMFTEVAEIEKITGLSFAEWQQQLGRYSITAVAALLHILRKRADVESDFETMQFAAADLDVIPLHDDGTDFTADEVAADLEKRMQEAQNPVPTIAADPAASEGDPGPATTASTSPASRNGSASARGSGSTSRGGTSRSSGRAPTRG